MSGIDWVITICFLSWLSYLNRKDIFALFIRFMPYTRVKRICSTHELVNWALHAIKYETDQELYGKEDYPALPEEFWKNKAGDCEDYAFFASDILSSHGYSAKSFAYECGSGKWHAVAIATKDNKIYYVFDLNNLIDIEATDLWDAIEKYTGNSKDKISEYILGVNK